ncbi:MAG: 6-carboxytetrahydropterin synthase [Chloroflexi bacterium]|nr:6-carboxytetrahydropterin synthase [Chloroflexota bacterium]
MPNNPSCANCFEEIRWTPTMWEGRPYCCDGCVMGGPCVCTYSGAPPRLDIGRILKAIGQEVSARSSPQTPAPVECENCFEALNRPAYYHEGRPYCCAGCADGGPCICTYGNVPPQRRPSVRFTDESHPRDDDSSAFAEKANSLWRSSRDDAESRRESGTPARANRLWAGQNEAPQAQGPHGSAEEVEAGAEEQGQPEYMEESRARIEKFQIAVSPLSEVRDVRRFTTQLESTPSVESVMLLHYAGERAAFEVEASSIMAVIKDVMDMEAFHVRSLRMVSEGLEITLMPGEADAPRVQVSAKELVAAAGFDRLTTRSVAQQPAAAPAPRDAGPRARVGDEGELHSFKYEMGVDVFFNGRHQVAVGDAKGPVHMHSWRAQAILEGESASESGQVSGSREVREIISSLVTPWNDKMLNRVPPFEEIMPTANNIARYIHDHVSARLSGKGVRLKAVRLWESPTSYVEYAGEGSRAVQS